MPRRKQDRPKRMKWEDGAPGKDASADGQSTPDDNAETGDDDGPVEGSDSSRSSSRSSTPDLSKTVDVPPQENPTSFQEPMDLVDATGAAPMDISSYIPNSSPLDVDGDNDEDDAADAGFEKKRAVEDDDGPLDFSVKKIIDDKASDAGSEDVDIPNGAPMESEDGPLDLSVPRRRKDLHHEFSRQTKMAKLDALFPQPNNQWGYNFSRHSRSDGLKHPSKDLTVWNGKVKELQDLIPSASKQLMRPTAGSMLHNKPISPPISSTMPTLEKGEIRKTSSKNESFRSGGRHNPWQSQWMNRSSEQTKDVFTCVWCKESFRSLAEMTVHMKQSPRCGMAGMQTSVPTSSSSSSSSHPPQPSMPSPKCSTSGNSSSLVKENVTLPRKLVRGQDVWLGKGAEQTRQILKCMWCGQSFKSLADMTTHMRVTQHYTNIISQEQIISWRTPEDKLAAQSQVNAVLTCKVCDQAFGSLKELSYHMVKNSHYKEHILRSITEGSGRRRQTRERRKKSLPVRKLLELERMELHKPPTGHHDIINSVKNEVVDGKISCEECTEKVDAKDFVQHIKNCGQGAKSHHSQKQYSGTDRIKTPDGPSVSNISSNIRSPLSAQEDSKASEPLVSTETETTETNTGSTSVLNAIERLIEKSFENRGRRHVSGTGILQRLGIDEEVYPPWHPSSSPNPYGVIRSGAELTSGKSGSPLSSMMLRPQDFKDSMEFSGSDSRSRSSSLSDKQQFDEQYRLSFGKDATNRVSTPSSNSQSCSPVHFMPESPMESRALTSREISPQPPSQKPVDSPHDSDDHNVEEKPDIKLAPNDTGASDMPVLTTEPTNEVSDDPLDCSANCDRLSPSKSKCSNSNSEQDIPPTLPKENIASDEEDDSSNKNNSPLSIEAKTPELTNNAVEHSPLSSPVPSRNTETKGQKGKNPKDHPLKELQKLLDKTDAHLSRPNLPATPGSILAFSWACNEATTSDSLMKCAFCETHFISKGAYRHHLSKMHFVKDGNVSDSWKSPGGNKSSNEASISPSKEIPTPPVDESPHSKFLKYTELAKQLSSKYV